MVEGAIMEGRSSGLTGYGHTRIFTDVAKERFEFWIEPETRKSLEAIKDRDGIPVAVQIRRAIDAWLADREATEKSAPRRALTRRRA
jgi:hypothetical protein